jgi:hypothetical protein
MMLVVAAVAVGIVGVRNCNSQMRALQIDRRNLVNWFVLAAPLLISVSVAIVLAELLPPRPRLSEVFRRPGFVANWVTSVVAAINALRMCTMNYRRLASLDSLLGLFDYTYFWPAIAECGAGVMVAWMTLALAGCWGPEPTGTDRLGRALGGVSIAAYAANNFSWLLWLP